MVQTIEETLVRHLRGTSFQGIPENAIDAARREILWALGTSLAGAADKGSDQVIAFVRQMGGCQEATVIGFGDCVPASAAGFANGAFAKALEYEDKFWQDWWHAYAVGTAIVPAAFAVAEHVGQVDGKSFLRAVALATDVQARMVKSVPQSLDTGWNLTYLLSAFGASMVAGLLLGLSEDEFLNAMGLAYAQTTGNFQGHEEGVLGVRMQMAFGVRNGITAAQLAKLGITGVRHFLTGKFGMYPLFFKDTSNDVDVLTTDLGHSFFGAQLGFKAYPCCAVIHPALDAVFSLMKEGFPGVESVEVVKVYGTTRMNIAVEPRESRVEPKNHVDSQFSLPWALACALVDGRSSLSHFREEALTDRRYLEVAHKVEANLEPTRDGVWVELKLTDGRVLASPVVKAPKGHPENPQTTEELVEKYRDCVVHGPKLLPRERTELAKDLVLGLDDVPDVAQVIKLLC